MQLYLKAHLAKQARRHRRRGTVCAVDGDAHPGRAVCRGQDVAGGRDGPIGRSISATGLAASPGTDHDESAMIDSTWRSRVSGISSPSPENTLMPLSSKGLCEAEMTTPAEYPQPRCQIGNRRRGHHTSARVGAA